MNDKPVAPEDVAVKTSTALVKVSEAYDQPTKPGPFSPALYASLQAAADFFNARFFDGALSDVVLTLQPHANSKGHFTWDAYAGRHGRDVPPCGINLNPDSFTGASDADIASTLLHELCHLWRHENGPPAEAALSRQALDREDEVGRPHSFINWNAGRPRGRLENVALRSEGRPVRPIIRRAASDRMAARSRERAAPRVRQGAAFEGQI